MFWRLKIFYKLLFPISLLILIIIIGSIGYMVIENYTFREAVYMTVITIGSVGYQEVHPLSDSGRLFTVFLILFNIGLFTYFIATLSRYLLDGEFMKEYNLLKMEHAVQQLKNHVIVCGFGRNGRESAQVLHDNNVPFVVVESKTEYPTDLEYSLKYFLKGDATKDETLLEAGIKTARALIITLPVDADNVFVVLTARQLNQKIKIISRASQDSSVNKLKIAGADNVIMPDKIGGAHMATLVMLPDIVEVLSLMATKNNDEFQVVELEASRSTFLQDLDLWKKTGCTVLSLKKENEYILNPAANTLINVHERLIVMGSIEQIKKAKQLV